MVAKGKVSYRFGSFGADTFWNTRFHLIHNSLGPENKLKFAQMPLWKKKAVVGRFIEKGLIF